MMYHDVLIAGFGGQGVLFMGNLLAQAGMEQGFQVTFMPAYGVEMRGGTANCNVIISTEEIGSPVPDNPGTAIVMNSASLDRFMNTIKPEGHLFYNSTLVPAEKVTRQDIRSVAVPANDLAQQLGSVQVASLVILSSFVEWTGIVPREAMPLAMDEMLPPETRKRFLDVNLAALEEGVKYTQTLRTDSVKSNLE